MHLSLMAYYCITPSSVLDQLREKAPKLRLHFEKNTEKSIGRD